MNRKYSRNKKLKYLNEEKLVLGELAQKNKEEYDAEVKRNEGKTRYDCKLKKHAPIKLAAGYIAKAVRSFHSDLAEVHNDNPIFATAVKLAYRSYNDLDNLGDPSSCQPKKVRATGAGRKTKAPEVRQALFAWFVDVRETFKGHLPRRLFKLKANQLYDEWLEQNSVPENERLKFSNCWI